MIATSKHPFHSNSLSPKMRFPLPECYGYHSLKLGPNQWGILVSGREEQSCSHRFWLISQYLKGLPANSRECELGGVFSKCAPKPFLVKVNFGEIVCNRTLYSLLELTYHISHQNYFSHCCAWVQVHKYQPWHNVIPLRLVVVRLVKWDKWN